MPNAIATVPTKKPIARSRALVKKATTKAVVKIVAVKPRATPSTREIAKTVAKKSAKAVATQSAAAQKISAPKVAVKSVAKAASPIVRESFTMTAADQELLKKCKRDAIAVGRDNTKKSEIVRAALRHFASLAASTQLMELNGLDPVKTGRPKKK
jgi:predicted ThiF/HesA family dinucleotide-utilizing enzyme